VVGYFSDATVINLDGLMNDDEILDVAQGKANITEYIDRHHIDWIMDYTSQDWQLNDHLPFSGIDVNRLEMVYSQSFDNYSFEPSIFYIFKVT
jgi:hypothetical protein